jgi:hypothetical protein
MSTFIDQTEIGITSEPVIAHDLKKYNGLKLLSRVDIQKAMMMKYGWSIAQYEFKINESQKFTVDELLSFRTLIEHYQDRENHPQP